MQGCKYASILSRNIFDPNLIWPKLFQTERTRQLAHLLSFCELVYFSLYGVLNVRGGWVGSAIQDKVLKKRIFLTPSLAPVSESVSFWQFQLSHRPSLSLKFYIVVFSMTYCLRSLQNEAFVGHRPAAIGLWGHNELLNFSGGVEDDYFWTQTLIICVSCIIKTDGRLLSRV